MRQNKNIFISIAASSLAVMLISIALKFLWCYGEKRILGHFFGAGGDLDAYLVALRIGMLSFIALTRHPAPRSPAHLDIGKESLQG